MGLAMMAYRVDIDRLVGLLGSKDKARRLAIRKAVMGSSAGRRFGREKGVSIAVSELIAGPPYPSLGRTASASDYGYAFEALCDAHGTSLFNNPVSPFRGDYLSQVGEHLEALGVGIVSKLSYRGAPISLPRPDDFPNIGHVTRDEAAAYVDAFAGKDLATETKALAAHRDWRAQMIEASEMFRAWVTEARANGQGIVAFTY